MKLCKLGVVVVDTVTGVAGMLTHALINMEKSVTYIFQPKGLDPETGQPVDRILVEGVRLRKSEMVDCELPIDALGTEAEDIATGFKGTVVGMTYHINGCIHVDIKPKGILSSGKTVDSADFDIRRVKGQKIKPFSEKKMEKDKVEKPSPISTKGVCR